MPHFELQPLTLGGELRGPVINVNTTAGVLINCPINIDAVQAKHLIEMAYAYPGQPYELSAWTGPEDDRRMNWSARLYWRE